MKNLIPSLLALIILAASISATPLLAQDATPTVIAIFPFKNLHNDVEFDELTWTYADSLEIVLNGMDGNGTTFEIISNLDVRDQLLAQNVDVKSPSYETDVWTIAEALEADKLIWGTYFTKYGKVFLKVEIIDLSINMPDSENVGESKGIKYEEALSSVIAVANQLLPGLAKI
jgi:TolB-like protein